MSVFRYLTSAIQSRGRQFQPRKKQWQDGNNFCQRLRIYFGFVTQSVLLQQLPKWCP